MEKADKGAVKPSLGRFCPKKRYFSGFFIAYRKPVQFFLNNAKKNPKNLALKFGNCIIVTVNIEKR